MHSWYAGGSINATEAPSQVVSSAGYEYEAKSVPQSYSFSGDSALQHSLKIWAAAGLIYDGVSEFFGFAEYFSKPITAAIYGIPTVLPFLPNLMNWCCGGCWCYGKKESTAEKNERLAREELEIRMNFIKSKYPRVAAAYVNEQDNEENIGAIEDAVNGDDEWHKQENLDSFGNGMNVIFHIGRAARAGAILSELFDVASENVNDQITKYSTFGYNGLAILYAIALLIRPIYTVHQARKAAEAAAKARATEVPATLYSRHKSAARLRSIGLSNAKVDDLEMNLLPKAGSSA